jgi:hypothetical protein
MSLGGLPASHTKIAQEANIQAKAKRQARANFFMRVLLDFFDE